MGHLYLYTYKLIEMAGSGGGGSDLNFFYHDGNKPRNCGPKGARKLKDRHWLHGMSSCYTKLQYILLRLKILIILRFQILSHKLFYCRK